MIIKAVINACISFKKEIVIFCKNTYFGSPSLPPSISFFQLYFILIKQTHFTNNTNYSIYHYKIQDMLTVKLLMVTLMMIAVSSTPLMIEEKDMFLEILKEKNIAIVFYGQSGSQQFQQFQQIIPTNNRLYSGIEFLHLPQQKFKLNRPAPSISIYRNIAGGDWVAYKGQFNKQDIQRWIKRNIFEHLPEAGIENFNHILSGNDKAFFILDGGQFELLRAKIYLQQFCEFQNIKCFKISAGSVLLQIGRKLFGLGKQDYGISKLAYYNPVSDHLELYPKDVWLISRQELLEMYEGSRGLVAADLQDPLSEAIEIQLHYQETQL